MLHNNKTDWSYFQKLLNASLGTNIKLKFEKDIKLAVERFNILQSAAWESTPFYKTEETKLKFCNSLKKCQKKATAKIVATY